MAEITIIRLGRLIAMYPAEYGVQFQDLCTVTRVIEERPSPENGWERRKVSTPKKLWWYDNDPISKQHVFCCFAGYSSEIQDRLLKQGHTIRMDPRVDSGAGYPDLSVLKLPSFRDFQIGAAARIFAANSGLIDAATGAGKTFLLKAISLVYPNATIVITVPYADVAKQIWQSLQSVIPDVGIVGGGKDRPARVTVAVSHSLHKCDPEANIVFADECHRLCTNNFINKLNRFRRAKLFGFSASLDGRSDQGDGFLQALFGPVLFKISYKDAQEAGNVVPIEVNFVRVDTGPAVDHIESKEAFDACAIWRNTERNSVIAHVTREIADDPRNQTLVVVDKAEHAYRLGQLLPDFTVVTGVLDPSRVDKLIKLGAFIPEKQRLCTAKERDAYRKAFEKGELRKVIATGVWNVGVDFVDLTDLVRADGLSGKHAAIQIPGRLARLGHDQQKPVGRLHDFWDAWSRRAKARSAARGREYNNLGYKVARP